MIFTTRFSSYLPIALVIILACALSVSSLIFFTGRGDITAYNDARAHLNMSRLVFDNLYPGLAQMGSVWLPLQHMLMLPFIWHDWLWQSGVAGSIVSMAGYIASGICLYFLARKIGLDKGVSILMPLAFLVNANALYMQAVPMTETLLLFFFIGSTYALVRWAQDNSLVWMIIAAGLLMASTITRYDGWFLLMWSFGVVLLLLWKKEMGIRIPFLSLVRSSIRVKTIFASKRARNAYARAWHAVEGKLILFATFASVGVLFWLGWNFVIFGDPLYFATGPYSAKSQQERIADAGSLHTAGNMPLSFQAYGWSMAHNIGWVLLVLAGIGLLFARRRMPKETFIVLTMLLSPFFFHVISLYAGNSILVVPEMGVHDESNPASAWFNVRYGLMMLPAAAVFGTYFLRRRFLQIGIAAALIFEAALMFYSGNIITHIDGTRGTSSLHVADVAGWMRENVKGGDLVLASIAFHNALAFETSFPLQRFVHEGAGNYWRHSLENPQRLVEWIVMASGDVGDEAYDSFMKNPESPFHTHYRRAYDGSFVNVYRRTEYVVQDGRGLYYKGRPFQFVGVNNFDLLHKPEDQIRETLRLARQHGFTVVRFWAFGEGKPELIQPNAGEINEPVAERLDAIMAIADEEDVRLIPVLANNWADYGGIPQYLDWLGLPNETPAHHEVFFTHPDARHLYKNYVEKIVNRTNSITGVPYKEDPVILAWELMNEPRSASRESGSDVVAWLQEMASYVRSLDENHLVIGGTEGFTEESYIDEAGPSLLDSLEPDDIHIASAHFYEKYLPDGKAYEEAVDDVLRDWGVISRERGRPLIIGEIGFSKLHYTDREQQFRHVLSQMDEHGIDGVLLWNWSTREDESYGISPSSEQDRDMLGRLRDVIVR